MTGAAKEAMPAGNTAGTPQILLAHHLKHLKLTTVLREYDKVARECARDGVDHPRYLLRLVELELSDRERRMVERRIRAARFPAVKSFGTFDFTAFPSLNKMLVLELARCGPMKVRCKFCVLKIQQHYFPETMITGEAKSNVAERAQGIVERE